MLIFGPIHLIFSPFFFKFSFKSTNFPRRLLVGMGYESLQVDDVIPILYQNFHYNESALYTQN